MKNVSRLIGVNMEINLNNLPKNINKNENLKINKFFKNYSSSTKYNFINFLPKCTYLYLSKVVNLYFTFITILILIPNISPFDPLSTVSGVLFLYGFTLLREGIENIQRWYNDKKENEQICNVIKNENYIPTKWVNLKVGDIVLLKENEFIPADIVQLSSNFENGTSFIETSNLDGEKNLKKKNSVKETFLLTNMRPFLKNKLLWYIDPPNSNLNFFSGKMYFWENNKFNNKYSILNLNNFLYKGTKLKNVEWVLGIIVYTGKDTKIMSNINKPKIKVSYLEKLSNKYILFILIVVLLIIISLFGIKYIQGLTIFEMNILNISYSTSTIETIMNYIIILSFMISINYTVSIELDKIFLGNFFNYSLELKSKNNKFCKVRTNQIIDDLSKIDFILSDKTGTITMNCLEFQGCFIGSEIYGGKILENQENNYEFIKNQQPNLGLIDFTFYDEDINLMLLKLKYLPLIKPLVIYDDLDEELISFHSQNELCYEFFKNLAITNECNVKMINEKIKYESPSPDDITLCNAANCNGIIYEGIEKGFINLYVNDKKIKWKKWIQFDFDSQRKSMSIVIEENNLVKIYIKGADTKIFNNLNPKNNNPNFIKKCKEYSHIFSTMGKRILLSAIRVMKIEDWIKLENEYKQILCDNREEELEEKKRQFIENFIEINLTLIGFSVLNDKLQDNVKYTIKKIINADIKFWMITGDNMETAKFISKSAGIISRKNEILNIKKEEDFDNLEKKIQEINKNNKNCSIVIDINKLNDILIIKKYIKSLILVDSVICSRCSPKNKGTLVKLVQDEGKLVLGIGDGANDVNLIQDSNIGIGLLGQEGNQAANVSDISIGEFQILWKLLFLYGRWVYNRISILILFTFYKNYLISLFSIIYGIYNAFSGISLFSGWYINAYNIFITASPIIILTFLDKDIDYRKLFKIKNNNYSTKFKFLKKLNPFLFLNKNFKIKNKEFIKNNIERLYYEFKNNKFFNFKMFVNRLVIAFFYCLIILIISKEIFFNITYYGLEYGFFEFGYVLYFIMVVYFNMILLWISYKIFLLLLLSIFFLSIFLYFILGVLASIFIDEEYLLFFRIFYSLPIFLLVLWTLVIGFMLEFLIKVINNIFYPSAGHYLNYLYNKYKNEKMISSLWNNKFIKNEKVEFETIKEKKN